MAIRTNSKEVKIPFFRVGEPEIKDLPDLIENVQKAGSPKG